MLTSDFDERTGEPKPLRPDVALDLARSEVVELRKRRLLGRDTRFDPVTDWYLMAWDAFKAAEFPADEARKLALALGLDLERDLVARRRMLKKKGASVQLLSPSGRRGRDRVDPDSDAFEVWIDAVHTAMLLYSAEGAPAAEAFLKRTGFVRDPTFKSLLQALVNAVPRVRRKVFPNDCPYCKTKHVSFEIRHHHLRTASPVAFEGYALVVCGFCDRAAVAVFKAPNQGGIFDLQFLKGLHPSMDISPPQHLPDSVKRRYEQGVAIMATAPEAAGMMFGKALEVALKTIRPNGRGILKNRIDEAAKAGAITSDLAEWAHRIRPDGNEAAHEDRPISSADLEELHRFTELVLLYLFTLPGMLKASRTEMSGPAATS